MRSVKDKTAAGLIIGLLICCGFLWLGAAAWERDELNYRLTEAVSRNDVIKARALLQAGANPNAPWSGYEWHDRLDNLLHHRDWSHYRILQFVDKNDKAMIRLLRDYGAKP